MSADHDRQSPNYCEQCGKPCAGVDVIAIDDDLVAQVSGEIGGACVDASGSVVKLYAHAEGSE